MSSIAGPWRLTMKTPIGTIEADYLFEDHGDAVRGFATDGGDLTELTDLTVTQHADGEKVTWSQRITRPMRLNLAYEVVVAGDSLVGESRAGRLPRTPVTGERTRP